MAEEEPIRTDDLPEESQGDDVTASSAAAAEAMDAQELPDETIDAEAMTTEALEAASEAAETIASSTGEPVELPSFDVGGQALADPAGALELLNDVQLHVKIELGRTRMYVEDVLRLNENSVVELDKAAGDPVDIYVNDRHVARGEVLVLNDNFCVRVSEIVQPAGPED